MIEISKVIEWDMGHRVPFHRNKCRNPHGHRYRLELTVKGELIKSEGVSNQGMIHDFSDIKSVMMERIHDQLDHGFMIYERDELMLKFFESQSEENFQVIVVPFVPTAEHIAHWCYQRVQDAFPKGIQVSRIRLYETPNSWADYIPS